MSKQRKTGAASDIKVAAEPSSVADVPKGPDAKESKKGGLLTSLWGWCNTSTVATLLVGLYVYKTIGGLRSLVYPLEGVTIPAGAPRIRPLWEEGSPVEAQSSLLHHPPKYCCCSVNTLTYTGFADTVLLATRPGIRVCLPLHRFSPISESIQPVPRVLWRQQ